MDQVNNTEEKKTEEKNNDEVNPRVVLTPESNPTYKLILIEIPAPVNSSSDSKQTCNAKVIGFTITDSSISEVFKIPESDTDNTITTNVSEKITAIINNKQMIFDKDITTDKLLGEKCLSNQLLNLLKDDNIKTIEQLKTGLGIKSTTSGGSNKQSTHKRKNRRHRRSQKK